VKVVHSRRRVPPLGLDVPLQAVTMANMQFVPTKMPEQQSWLTAV
jgi:hypothetical protein